MTLGFAVDPGYRAAGVCIAEWVDGKPDPHMVDTLRTRTTEHPEERLNKLARELVELAGRCPRIDWIAYEDQSIPTNKAIQNSFNRRVHEVCGFVRMLGLRLDVPIYTVRTATVKLEMTGNGKAVKDDMKAAARTRFKLRRLSDHAADACGVWLAARKMHSGVPLVRPRVPFIVLEGGADGHPSP